MQEGGGNSSVCPFQPPLGHLLGPLALLLGPLALLLGPGPLLLLVEA